MSDPKAKLTNIKKEQAKVEQIQRNKELNPDDIEAGEELLAVKIKQGKAAEIEKHEELNPDDLE